MANPAEVAADSGVVHVTPELSFHLRCVPPTTTHHAKKIARVRKFSRLVDRPELVAAKEAIDALLLPHQPPAPIGGAVHLSFRFSWPFRKSEPKRNLARPYLWHTSRPDCTNLAKTLEDRLVALRFLEDDNAVACIDIIKTWSHEPGITVKIWRLE